MDPGESGGFRSPPVALESEHWLQLNCLGPRRRGAGKRLGSRHPGQVPEGKPGLLVTQSAGGQGRIRTRRTK